MTLDNLFADSEFSGTIDSARDEVSEQLRAPAETTDDVPDDQKLTVFAPINSAFRENDFAQEFDTKAMVNLPQRLILLRDS